MISRRLASSSARRLPCSVQDIRTLAPASSFAPSSRLTLGLRHSSDLAEVVPELASSPSDLPTAGALDALRSAPPPNDASPYAGYLPALAIAPYPRVARKRLAMDRNVLPALKPFVYPRSPTSVDEWNERLRALLRSNPSVETVNRFVHKMRQLHVRMDETTVGLLVGSLDYRPPTASSDKTAVALVDESSAASRALGAELYVLPDNSLPKSFAEGTRAVQAEQAKVKAMKSRFAKLQQSYAKLSADLAAYAKSNPPVRPDYFVAPFPELDALEQELKQHYDQWNDLVPQYDAAVTVNVNIVATAEAAVADAQRELAQVESQNASPSELEALRATLREAREFFSSSRETLATSRDHAKAAVAFRDNFKRKREALPQLRAIDGYPTPSLDDFIRVYTERHATMPKDNRAVWKKRLAKDRQTLLRLAEEERALEAASTELIQAEEAIAEVRASTDLSKVNYEALAESGQAEYNLMREAQRAGQHESELERALVASQANQYPAEVQHVQRLIDDLMHIEQSTINELSVDAWSSAARRLAAVRARSDGSLAADWIGAFVAAHQLYNAWLARHGATRPGTEISIVVLEALANLVKATPAYPPALRLANSMADRLLSNLRGAGVRAVRENPKRLDASTPIDFKPLPPLAVRHEPIHRLLNALSNIIGGARPAKGVEPDVLEHMTAVSDTIRAQVDGFHKGLFNLEDYAELSQPKREEGARMRVTVERLAGAYESKLAELRRG